MVILIAPPRSGSSVATNILKELHPNIFKTHYAKIEDNFLICDNVKKFDVKEIEAIYYQHRFVLECVISHTVFEHFDEIVSREEYVNYVNSKLGIAKIRLNLEKYLQFGINVISRIQGNNKIILQYSSLKNPIEYISPIPDQFFEQANTNREDFAKKIVAIQENTRKEKSTSSLDSRLLTNHNLSPLSFMNPDSMIFLRYMCEGPKMIAACPVIDEILKANNVKHSFDIVDP